MGIDTTRIEDWLFGKALPWWSQRAPDHAHGGTVEELTLDGGPSDPGFKRVRVPCRQVYVWSHASLLGWRPGLALARREAEALARFAWQGRDKGWARRLGPDNSVLDGRPDLYDTAFAIFGLSWLHRAGGDAWALDLALETLDFVETRMAWPETSGFAHALPPEGPRIQNPHMHLLEACLAGWEASRNPAFATCARHVLNLFATRFFDRASGTLGEVFDAGWARLGGAAGRIVEPGHQFEWAWILAEAHRLFGHPVHEDARALIAFAERHGVDAAGATRNSVRDDGLVLDGGSRTWPNTERVKAAVATLDLFGEDPAPALERTLGLLFSRYLLPDGGWIDAFDAAGRPVAKAMPVSTFYHVFLALAEVLRVAPRL